MALVQTFYIDALVHMTLYDVSCLLWLPILSSHCFSQAPFHPLPHNCLHAAQALQVEPRLFSLVSDPAGPFLLLRFQYLIIHGQTIGPGFGRDI